MDSFTQRMVERAKKSREKLDTHMTNAGHDVRARRSPLRDANIFSTAITQNLTASNVTVAPQASSVSVENTNDNFSSQESLNSGDQIMKSPPKPSLVENKKLSIRNDARDKENVEKNVSNVRSKLHRMGKLYSDDCSRELSSPIHRTEEKFAAEDEESLRETKDVKRGARINRFAALASEINNWEDDLSHPTIPPLKKGESKAEKIQAKMNEQVKAGGSTEPQPSTSGYGRWKSNADTQPGNNSLNRQFKWDKTVIENLEAQGYIRTKSNSRLIYDYKNCSQDNKSPKDTKGDNNKRKNNDSSTSTKIIQTTENHTTKSPTKNTKILDTSIKSTSSNGSRNRFGNYNGSPKSTVQSGSPGSVLSKASLFETKNSITRTKDPAEMTLSERLALFERNKGEALIPKAPLSSSVPTKKLMEQREKPTSSNHSSDQLMRNGSGSSVSSNRALFEQGIAKQEVEKDVISDSQNERLKELEMLRSRYNKNKENAQAAAGSCIRPRQNSEPTTVSPKNSPICPVKPTPAMDYVPPAPPLPGSPMASTRSEPIQTRCSPSKRQVAGTPPSSKFNNNKHQSNFNDIKRQKVSSPSRLYPNLAEMESSETETPDTEYTIGTTEAETVTCDETDYDDYQEESNIEDIASSSFENSVLRVVKDRHTSINKKRTIEPSNDDSSTSDISVLDEMNEFLEGCLDDDDDNDNDDDDNNNDDDDVNYNRRKQRIGPTPPKLNRAAESDSPSMASKSFKYTHGSSTKRSPLVVTPKREQYIVDDGNKVPLMHSVSFYRRQQSQTPKTTPIKSISRTVEIVSDYDYTSGIDEKQEEALVQDKIKYLKDEVNKQQTIIGQSSQAVNLCAATIEFSGSREQVEGERTLLIATHRRQAALNEIQRLKVEGTLRPSAPGSSSVQESGTLTVSALTLPLKKHHINNSDNNTCIHFLCLIRHLDTIIATPIVLAEPGDSCIRFPSTLKLDNLYSDFKVTIEVYSLETRAEILPHDVKYHIHNNGHSNNHSSNHKKHSNKTPKKYLKQESRLIMPTVQSPAGPSAVRTPSFTLSGYVIFSLKEINRQQFTLNKVPRNSPLESRLQMHVTCELSVDVEHRGFLTMFEDVSGFGAWHRRWCLLKGDTLSYWKYPDDEKKKTPIGSLELQGVTTKNVGLVARDICARPNTFLLETVRSYQSNDVESLTVVRCGSLTTIRHLLSADTKEERLEWCSKLNQTLNLLRAWSGNS